MSINRILPATTAALAVLCAAPATSEMRFDISSGGYNLFYGQINPAYVGVDDGVEGYNELVDNSNSNSRIGYWFRQPTGAGLFSFNFETGLGLRQSSLVSQDFKPKAWNLKRISLRKIDFSLRSEISGTISLGQGSMAHDGAAEVDLSETSVAVYSWIAAAAGGYSFRDTAGTLSDDIIGTALPNFDGDRRLRVRYDTPSFNGFSASASYGEEILIEESELKSTSVALRYSGTIGPVKMEGAIGYGHIIDSAPGVTFNDVIGSFSMLHDSGFNATFAAGSREDGGKYGYVKLGHIGQWFPVGSTALSIDYYDGRDTSLTQGSKSKSYGLAAVQNFDDVPVEAYLAVRGYGLSVPGTRYQDISSVLMGARWKF